jgi:uncharacterized protein YbgA (DUF1722 family)/uncharacterized protein YbbK (DUF523 family)
MDGFPKPRVVVSKCLEFAPCRYNGQGIPSRVVRRLRPFVEFVPVCAEMEIGLGVPRQPVRVISQKGALRLQQHETERDVTEAMTTFAESYCRGLSDVDGFILKSRSPSCGIKEVRMYPRLGKVAHIGSGTGFFARAILDRFGRLPVEDEGRLKNYEIRDHFLTRLFLWARFRQVKRSAAMADLVQFHAANKFLLLAHNQQILRTLGRIVANHERKPLEQVFAAYESHLGDAFPGTPSGGAMINVFQHLLGYFSKRITDRERHYLLALFRRVRKHQVPTSAPLSVLRSWSIRFGEEYLLQQSVFQPYPEELMDVTDSGKGRSL